jgi:hypothetical protein
VLSFGQMVELVSHLGIGVRGEVFGSNATWVGYAVDQSIILLPVHVAAGVESALALPNIHRNPRQDTVTVLTHTDSESACTRKSALSSSVAM